MDERLEELPRIEIRFEGEGHDIDLETFCRFMNGFTRIYGACINEAGFEGPVSYRLVAIDVYKRQHHRMPVNPRPTLPYA